MQMVKPRDLKRLPDSKDGMFSTPRTPSHPLKLDPDPYPLKESILADDSTKGIAISLEQKRLHKH